MAVKVPKWPVFNYEVSAGEFRLTYFISPEEPEGLAAKGEISQQALSAFPDGIDLVCTEPDVRAFEDEYAYRPDYDPVALRDAFYAILSTTRGWKKFRGSGLIPASVVQKALTEVEEALEPDELAPVVDQEPLEGRQLSMQRLTSKSGKKLAVRLRKLQVEGIDSKRSLAEQNFPRVHMRGEETTEKVFTRLLRKHEGR